MQTTESEKNVGLLQFHSYFTLGNFEIFRTLPTQRLGHVMKYVDKDSLPVGRILPKARGNSDVVFAVR